MTPSTTNIPLLLWPGLAADERLFAPLVERCSNLRTPAFIEPEPREDLRTYARRYAEHLGPSLPEDGRYAVGGFSFGGQLAQELATVLDPKPLGVVLICGVRGRHQILPGFVRQQRIGALVPGFIARRLYTPVARRFAKREGLDAAATQLLVDMASATEPAFLSWAAAACAHWQGPPSLDVPIRHIHGAHDDVIPDMRSEADETIEDAGHLITLTHPDRVAAFVDSALAGFARESVA